MNNYNFCFKDNLLLILILGITSMFTACSQEADSIISDKNKFYLAYTNLYLVHNSPDYPANVDVLAACLKSTNEGCYKVVQRVKNAKQTLQNEDNKTALTFTINTIIKHCHATVLPDTPDESLCEGAITALYFFDRQDQNQFILSEFSKLDKNINTRIFKRNREWYYNRQNINSWLVLINEKLQNNELDLQTLRFTFKNVRPFGLMLLQNPVPHGETLSY